MMTKNSIKVTEVDIKRAIERAVCNFQWERCMDAYDKLAELNGLTSDACECVSDSGGIPIFAYGNQDIESWKIPNSYTMHKLGEAQYALMKGSSKQTPFLKSAVVCHFVDDWPDFE